MKLIPFLLIFASCSSLKNFIFGPDPIKLEIGETYEQVKLKTQHLEESELKLNNKTFICYTSGMCIVFEDNKLIFKAKPDQKFYNISLKSKSDGKGIKTIAIYAYDEKLEITLDFRELKSELIKVLNWLNVKVVEPNMKPDAIIFFEAGVGEPKKHTSSRKVPIYGYEPNRTIKTSTSYDVNSLYGYQGNISGSSTTVIQGQGLFVQGYDTETIEYTTYSKYLKTNILSVNYSNPKNPKIQETQYFNSVIDGPTLNLEPFKSALFASFIDYWGKSSQGIQTFEYSENSVEIFAVDYLFGYYE